MINDGAFEGRLSAEERQTIRSRITGQVTPQSTDKELTVRRRMEYLRLAQGPNSGSDMRKVRSTYGHHKNAE